MTIYLKFDTQEQAIAALTAAGYAMSEYNDHFSGDGWGTLFQIPYDTGTIDESGEAIYSLLDGWFANLYDSETTALDTYRVPDPETPYNVKA